MNIFELLTFLAFIVAGYFCGKLLGLYYGIIGWVVGVAIGIALAICVWIGLDKLIRQWYKWRPFRPVCKKGKCFTHDYRLIECSQMDITLQCRCGTKYLYRENERRFMEILEDGTIVPYMKRKGAFGRWELEKPQEHKA